MTTQVPAGKISHVRKQGSHAGFHHWLFEPKFHLAIFFGNRVVALNGYGSEGLLPGRYPEADPNVVHDVDGGEEQKPEKNANPDALHRQRSFRSRSEKSNRSEDHHPGWPSE